LSLAKSRQAAAKQDHQKADSPPRAAANAEIFAVQNQAQRNAQKDVGKGIAVA
jgi:hypothetical protein